MLFAIFFPIGCAGGRGFATTKDRSTTVSQGLQIVDRRQPTSYLSSLVELRSEVTVVDPRPRPSDRGGSCGDGLERTEDDGVEVDVGPDQRRSAPDDHRGTAGPRRAVGGSQA